MVARNAMEIFSLLDKSNCRKCGEKTCLAFAGAVFTNRRTLDECPVLSDGDKAQLTHDKIGDETEVNLEEEMIGAMLDKLAVLDFTEVADRCGGTAQHGKLTVKIMGKDFSVDKDGKFSSAIHINPWVVAPFLVYITEGKGRTPVNSWISFREMKGGMEKYALFQKRCEEDMRKVADAYPDLFSDMVEIFQGREVEKHFASDISVVLRPLPKLPIMICYWQAEDGMDSSLNIFFDATADDNIGLDGVYSLCAGLMTMFEKLAKQHGFQG